MQEHVSDTLPTVRCTPTNFDTDYSSVLLSLDVMATRPSTFESETIAKVKTRNLEKQIALLCPCNNLEKSKQKIDNDVDGKERKSILTESLMEANVHHVRKDEEALKSIQRREEAICKLYDHEVIDSDSEDD
jgi:hypothetical protein